MFCNLRFLLCLSFGYRRDKKEGEKETKSVLKLYKTIFFNRIKKESTGMSPHYLNICSIVDYIMHLVVASTKAKVSSKSGGP